MPVVLVDAGPCGARHPKPTDGVPAPDEAAPVARGGGEWSPRTTGSRRPASGSEAGRHTWRSRDTARGGERPSPPAATRPVMGAAMTDQPLCSSVLGDARGFVGSPKSGPPLGRNTCPTGSAAGQGTAHRRAPCREPGPGEECHGKPEVSVRPHPAGGRVPTPGTVECSEGWRPGPMRAMVRVNDLQSQAPRRRKPERTAAHAHPRGRPSTPAMTRRRARSQGASHPPTRDSPDVCPIVTWATLDREE